MAKTSAAQQRAVHKYVKNNYDRLELSVPKGEKATIQQAAKQAGQSVNAYKMCIRDSDYPCCFSVLSSASAMR